MTLNSILLFKSCFIDSDNNTSRICVHLLLIVTEFETVFRGLFILAILVYIANSPK